MAIWGPLISAGATILGGLFGGKKESTTSEIDYVKLRENAERAGFNPLTALRAGGGAGFTTTHHPALSAGSFIADAIGGLGNAIAQIDPMRDATAKLEYDLKQATLANIQADTASRMRASLGGVPVSTGARTVAASSVLANGQPLAPSRERPTVTNPWTDGEINSLVYDAANFEQRYGGSEVAETAAFWRTATADAYAGLQDWYHSQAPLGTITKIKNPTERQKSWWPTITVPPSQRGRLKGYQ